MRSVTKSFTFQRQESVNPTKMERGHPARNERSEKSRGFFGSPLTWLDRLFQRNRALALRAHTRLKSSQRYAPARTECSTVSPFFRRQETGDRRQETVQTADRRQQVGDSNYESLTFEVRDAKPIALRTNLNSMILDPRALAPRTPDPGSRVTNFR